MVKSELTTLSRVKIVNLKDRAKDVVKTMGAKAKKLKSKVHLHKAKAEPEKCGARHVAFCDQNIGQLKIEAEKRVYPDEDEEADDEEDADEDEENDDEESDEDADDA